MNIDFNEKLFVSKADFVATVDPGLKGGCSIFCLKSKGLFAFELPLKETTKREERDIIVKQQLDCIALQSNLLGFAPFGTRLFLALEKPFKKDDESINSFASSMKMFGELIAIFDLNYTIHLYPLSPISWTSYFDQIADTSKYSKEKRKSNRAKCLIEKYGVADELIYTPRKRLKDGVVDALAMQVFLAETEQKFNFIKF